MTENTKSTLSFTDINEVRPLIVDLFESLWGSDEMILSSGVYNINKLDGLVAHEGDDIVGIVTYEIKPDLVEIVSLNSFSDETGIGTSLLDQVKLIAKDHHLDTINIITTNDNVQAQQLYEYLGFSAIDVIEGAVDEARKIKPDIPIIADNALEIHDEILYELKLNR
ncbi:GNAT family N-acetyltransferase [Lentilactobacillus sp. SPB1-3]|uniref:GNAT family N-acetyltransferase n=1 Tax=Lentilactobacillus terminaliae TaxID=3003483 RepID=A0ACD5DDD4_9LACO|nr:GNAT family N-acetyltransferase [Lentilactobacillus sp. SPB1-3]MCZ0977988.1 GNAT family N-acetyltransferase [Lentilactobacillus sp. SPB1-3]